MASDGLANRAKNGKCRMCQRVRSTTKYVKPVGEVHHGFATGYIWECIDTAECDKVIEKKMKSYDPATMTDNAIRSYVDMNRAVGLGRKKEYTITL